MCLSLPGKVLEIDNGEKGMLMAKVDFNSVIQEVCVEFIQEVKVGDYILVHAGVALTIMDEESALNNINGLTEMVEALEKENIK